MQVQPIRTDIIAENSNLTNLIDRYIHQLNNDSILVITSKIVALCEGNHSNEVSQKHNFITNQADLFLDDKKDFILTIKNNILIPNSGIDESNSNGKLIFWPNDPFGTANGIRDHLIKKFSLKNVGVIITDSKTDFLRWGTTGVALGFAGFMPTNNYIGKKDLFNYQMQVSKTNIVDALSTAAVVTMGEGDEQTPLAVITNIPFVKWTNKKFTQYPKLSIKKDLYAPILTQLKWKKSKK